jgi:signal transduction histidine kinase
VASLTTLPLRRKKHLEPTAVPDVNVVFIGGGKGCYDILHLLNTYNPAKLRPHVLGVADPNPEAKGRKYAEEIGIQTSSDYRAYLVDDRIDLIIELTGNDEILADIHAGKLAKIKVLDHLAALFLWEIIDIQEEKLRLEKKISDLDTMAAIGEIAYKLTHELRNPLLITGGLVRRMMTRVDLPHGIRKRFKHIAGHVLHMENVISDICDVIRPLRPHYKLTDMNEFFQHWFATVRTEARFVGATVQFNIEKELPTMYIDPLLIRQALWHILENSLDAIAEREGVIYIDVQICWDTIAIQLSDSGEGFLCIAPSQAVQPFTTTKSGRMGLGLALCRQIILDHGGDLKIVEKPDGHSLVYVELPITYKKPGNSPGIERMERTTLST